MRGPNDIHFSVHARDGCVDGVITDHVYRALDAGYVVRVAASGRTYVHPAAGGTAVPVLCGEIVPVLTEDGWTDGRCALPVMNNERGCPGHEPQIAAWADERSEQYVDDRADENEYGLWIDSAGGLHEGI